MDVDELLDNGMAFADEDDDIQPMTWADLRLRKSGRDLRAQQEAEYLGIDPDDYED
jgi:hypothetical protein